MVEPLSAYSVLQTLAKSSLSSAQQLPAQIDVVPQWSGVGFSLLGFDFVVPMEELEEMLEVPPYTKLPSVHHWVKGVSNVRGRLLPLFDLAAFFSGSLIGNKKYQRLLVLDNQHIYAGLWVDRVFGMQYFSVDTKNAQTPSDVPARVAEFVDGFYEMDGRQWMVFRPQALLQDTEFLNVAVA